MCSLWRSNSAVCYTGSSSEMRSLNRSNRPSGASSATTLAGPAPAERQYDMRRCKRPFLEVKLDREIAWEYPNPFPNRSEKIPNYTVFRVAELARTGWDPSRAKPGRCAELDWNPPIRKVCGRSSFGLCGRPESDELLLLLLCVEVVATGGAFTGEHGVTRRPEAHSIIVANCG
jgi:hypothetical protein